MIIFVVVVFSMVPTNLLRLFLCVLVFFTSVSLGAILGIDLGSQWTKVALVKPGIPFQIVTNTASKRKTSTLVGFDSEYSRIYAGDAENVMKRKPTQVFPMSRNMLGRHSEHLKVQDIQRTGFIDQHELFGDLERNGAVRLRNTLGVVVQEDVVSSSSLENEDEKTESGTEAEAEGSKKVGGKNEAEDKAQAASTSVTQLHLPSSFAVEEIIGFLLGYAKTIGESYAEESRINDCVITVPSFFTQSEREAVLDAAAIAKLSVLDLIDENVAAAVQFGVDRVYENRTHKVLFYNMGSSSIQATVVEYSSRQMKRFGKNVTSSVFQVLSKGWDEGVGGAYFDMLLANDLADHFNAMMRERKGDAEYDVRTASARGWAKIKAQATKTKKVLSANDAIPVFIASVDEDRDLTEYKISRRQLENMSGELLERVTGPIDRALAQANLTASDLDAVEIIGGGVRMPKIQELVKERLGVEQLSVHLNGDEAMALGAAFRAANISSSFRTRHVGMQDINPFPIGVRMSGEASDDDNDVEDDDGGEEQAVAGDDVDGGLWTKRATLFKRNGFRDRKRAVAFKRDRDFTCTLHYEEDANVPKGTAKTIREYKVSGMEKFATDDTLTGLDGPKVNLAFHLDARGIVSLSKAEAVFEEIVEYEEEVEIEEEDDDDANAGSDAEAATAEDEEAKDEEAKDVENAENAAETDSDESAETGSDESAETDSADADDEKKKKTKTVTRTRKKKHRRSLKVSEVASSTDEKRSINGLRHAQTFGVLGGYSVAAVGALQKSHALVNSMDQADAHRTKHAISTNALEAFVYSARDFIRDEDHGAHEVTTEDDRESLLQKLEEVEEWLYDVTLETDIAIVDTKRADLETIVNDVRERVSELKARPLAMKALRGVLATTETHIERWAEKRPQVDEAEIEKLLAKVNTAREWIEKKESAQSELLPTETPAFKSKEVSAQVRSIQRTLRSLLEKPKVKSIYLNAPVPSKASSDNKEAAENPSVESDTDKVGDDAAKNADGEVDEDESASSVVEEEKTDDDSMKDEL
eukprot:g3885.t1